MNTMVEQDCARSHRRSHACARGRHRRALGRAGRGAFGVAGTWKDLTDTVNELANDLTTQVRNIAEVTTSRRTPAT